MEVHASSTNKPRFLVVDSAERVAELPTDFLNWLERRPGGRLAPLSVERYAQRAGAFFDFFEAELPDDVSFDDGIKLLELNDVDLFYGELEDMGLGAGTIRGYEVAVKQFANWLTTQSAGRVHATSIYEGVDWRTNTGMRRVPRYVLKDTVIALLEEMHIEEHRLATHLMFDAGMRVSEVARAQAIDLPNPDQYPADIPYLPLYVRGSKGRAGEIKGRYTIISRPMLARIRRYHNTLEYRTAFSWSAEDKPLLLNSDQGAWTSKALQKAVRDAHARSSLKEKVGCHRLRHGMAVSILSSDIGESLLDNLLILQKLLGHNELSTTEKYTEIPVTVLQEIRKSNAALGRSRVTEADEIFRATYLPRQRHAANKRGPKQRT